MKFTVIWTEAAEAELARIWLGSRYRARLGEAAQRIDEALSQDPEREGESRDGVVRVLLVDPLGVEFFVTPEKRLVNVTAVWARR